MDMDRPEPKKSRKRPENFITATGSCLGGMFLALILGVSAVMCLEESIDLFHLMRRGVRVPARVTAKTSQVTSRSILRNISYRTDATGTDVINRQMREEIWQTMPGKGGTIQVWQLPDNPRVTNPTADFADIRNSLGSAAVLLLMTFLSLKTTFQSTRGLFGALMVITFLAGLAARFYSNYKDDPARAAYKGDLAALERCVRKGVDLSARPSSGLNILKFHYILDTDATPLQKAIQGQQLEALRFLVNHGAKLKAEDLTRAMENTLRWGEPEALSLMIRLLPGSSFSADPELGASLLNMAVRGKKPLLIPLLLEADADPFFEKRHKGIRPSLKSAILDDSDYLPLFLTGDKMLSENGKGLLEAIELAAAKGRRKSLRSLINKYTFLYPQEKESVLQTSLITACRAEQWEVVTQLKALGASLDAPLGAENLTPLMDQVINGKRRRIEKLISLGASVDERVGDRGFAALHIAAAKLKSDMAQALMDSGASVNLPDNSGATPLHYCCKAGGKTTIISFFLARGADLSAGAGTQAGTPLHAAVESGNYLALTKLLKEGADSRLTDSLGRTPAQRGQQILDSGQCTNYLRAGIEDCLSRLKVHEKARHTSEVNSRSGGSSNE